MSGCCCSLSEVGETQLASRKGSGDTAFPSLSHLCLPLTLGQRLRYGSVSEDVSLTL